MATKPPRSRNGQSSGRPGRQAPLAPLARLAASLARRPGGWAALALSAAALAAAALFAHRSHLAGAGPGDKPLSWRWHPGRVLDYALVYDVTGRTNVAALTAGAAPTTWQPVATKVTSHLRLATLAADPDGSAVVAGELSELTATSTVGAQAAAGVPPPGTTLRFQAAVDARGRWHDLAFPDDATTYARNLVRSVLSLAQVRFPDAPATTWTLVEEAPGGPQAATYQVAGHAGAVVTLAKSLADPAPAKPSASTYAQTAERRTTGSFRIAFDADHGRPTRIDGARERHVAVAGMPVGEETAHVLLTLAPDGDTPLAGTPPPRLHPAAGPSDLSGTDELTRLARAGDEALVGKATLEDLVAGVEAADAKRLHDVQPVYEKLIAFLRLHPDRCRDVAARLASVPDDALAFEALAMALTAAGSPEAQAALADVIASGAGGDAHKAELLVPHLALVDQPTAATEDFLRGLTQSGATSSLRHTATLALGSVGHDVLDADPARAGRLVRELGDGLAAAGSPRDRSLYLSALGNVGHPSQTALVSPYLTSDDAALRERAASALRYVDTDEARSLLQTAATHDPSEAVRARAVESLSFTPGTPATLATYQDLLAHPSSVAVAKEAAHGLFLLAKARPEALTALRAYASRCGHPDLCPYVAGLVRSADAALAQTSSSP